MSYLEIADLSSEKKNKKLKFITYSYYYVLESLSPITVRKW